jgi:nucleoside-diphosphate-sugar epimerase
MSKKSEHILITGAGGFIGQALVSALLQSDSSTNITMTDVSVPPIPSQVENYKSQITATAIDLTNSEDANKLLAGKFDVYYLLHGIMSSGSEANLELGYRVNLDSHRFILDYLREHQQGAKVVFPSSLAVFGPVSRQDEVVSETTMPFPQSSYGTQKFMIECLINDYSRRGLVDGRSVRLPTVIVRPGKPTAAASSFASGIVRESLAGVRNTLPVRSDLDMWVGSPDIVVQNLVLVKNIPKERFGIHRTVCLPGQTVSVQQILEALERVGGKEKRNLVIEERDPVIEKIVESWPSRLDTNRAFTLGMHKDISLTEIVQNFAERHVK